MQRASSRGDNESSSFMSLASPPRHSRSLPSVLMRCSEPQVEAWLLDPHRHHRDPHFPHPPGPTCLQRVTSSPCPRTNGPSTPHPKRVHGGQQYQQQRPSRAPPASRPALRPAPCTPSAVTLPAHSWLSCSTSSGRPSPPSLSSRCLFPPMPCPLSRAPAAAARTEWLDLRAPTGTAARSSLVSR